MSMSTLGICAVWGPSKTSRFLRDKLALVFLNFWVIAASIWSTDGLGQHSSLDLQSLHYTTKLIQTSVIYEMAKDASLE